MSERGKDNIRKQAAKWFVLMQEGELSRIARHRYDRWLNQSPAHAAEMSQMQRLHRLLHHSLPNREANGS